jgi:NTE family protein
VFRFLKRNGDTEGAGVELGGVALGPRPWLVLGGGGLKGLAHLGVWRALQTRGFEPDGILGTSIGGLMGALISAGRDPEEMLTLARELSRSDIARVQRRALWVSGFRAEALFRRDPLQEYLEAVLPAGGWEALHIRFQTNAVELGRGQTEWFGIGARTDVPLAQAIYATAALPVFYPPAKLPGGYYVDGGVEFALPIHRAAELGATGIVAVDPGAGEEGNARAVALGGMLAVHQRVFSLMAGRLRREMVRHWEGVPLLYIRPPLDGYGTFDFENIPYFLEAGEQAGEEILTQSVAST